MKILIIANSYIDRENLEGEIPTDPDYKLNKIEIGMWIRHNEKFLAAYNNWVESGYKIAKTPCIVFKKDYRGATTRNMKISTWKYYRESLPADYNYNSLRIMSYNDNKYLGTDNLGIHVALKGLGLYKAYVERHQVAGKLAF